MGLLSRLPVQSWYVANADASPKRNQKHRKKAHLSHTQLESQEKSTVGLSSALLLVQASEYAPREVSEGELAHISDENGGIVSRLKMSQGLEVHKNSHIKRNWAMSHNVSGTRIKCQLTPILNMTVSVGRESCSCHTSCTLRGRCKRHWKLVLYLVYEELASSTLLQMEQANILSQS